MNHAPHQNVIHTTGVVVEVLSDYMVHVRAFHQEVPVIGACNLSTESWGKACKGDKVLVFLREDSAFVNRYEPFLAELTDEVIQRRSPIRTRPHIPYEPLDERSLEEQRTQGVAMPLREKILFSNPDGM